LTKQPAYKLAKKQNHTPKREKEVRQKTTTNKNHQTHY
jgi:hypothetical protein